MDMDPIPFETGNIESHTFCVRPEVASRSPSRLLHDVSQLTGDRQVVAAGEQRGFDIEDIPAGRSPGEPRGHPCRQYLARLLRHEAFGAEPVGKDIWLNGHRSPFLALRKFRECQRDLPGQATEHLLQLANSCLPGIAAGDES